MPILLLLFVVVPIVELYAIIQVGQAIGAGWTILLLIADSVLGTVLMRSQGRRAWLRFSEAVASGRPPAKETVDGALVILGGALLVTPGFISDLLGFSLLLPPTRALIRRLVLRNVTSRMVASFAAGGRGGFGPAGFGAPPRRRSPFGDADVEGTAREVDPPGLGPRGY